MFIQGIPSTPVFTDAVDLIIDDLEPQFHVSSDTPRVHPDFNQDHPFDANTPDMRQAWKLAESRENALSDGDIEAVPFFPVHPAEVSTFGYLLLNLSPDPTKIQDQEYLRELAAQHLPLGWRTQVTYYDDFNPETTPLPGELTLDNVQACFPDNPQDASWIVGTHATTSVAEHLPVQTRFFVVRFTDQGMVVPPWEEGHRYLEEAVSALPVTGQEELLMQNRFSQIRYGVVELSMREGGVPLVSHRVEALPKIIPYCVTLQTVITPEKVQTDKPGWLFYGKL